MHRTAATEQEKTFERLSSGANMHYAEFLWVELKKLQIEIPLALRKRLRRFPWSTAIRYEFQRRRVGEARGLLKTASDLLVWAERNMT